MKVITIILSCLLGLSLFSSHLYADVVEAEKRSKAEKEESTKRGKVIYPRLSRYRDQLPIINFGVLHNSDKYTFYRSSFLGKIGLKKLKKHLDKKSLPMPKTVIYMNKSGYLDFPPIVGDFALKEYKMQEKMGFRFYHSFDYKNRTYLDGHDPYNPKGDIDAGLHLGFQAREVFGRLKDGKKDGGIDAFLRIMKIVLNPANQPVLFHCLGGRHRTGMVGLILRYLEGGEWINGPKRVVDPVGEAKKMHLNPAQYEYYTHNKDFFRPENLAFIEKFVNEDERFEQLKVSLMEDLGKSKKHEHIHTFEVQGDKEKLYEVSLSGDDGKHSSYILSFSTVDEDIETDENLTFTCSDGSYKIVEIPDEISSGFETPKIKNPCGKDGIKKISLTAESEVDDDGNFAHVSVWALESSK